MMIKVKNYWSLVAGLSCLAAGLVIYFILIPLTIEQRSSIAANVFFTDARFMPKIWGVLMIFLSAGAVLESLSFRRSTFDETKVVRIDRNSVRETFISSACLVALMCAYVFFLPILGFVICSAVMVAVSLYLFDFRQPFYGVIIVVVTTLTVYYVWVKLLYVYFPYPIFPFPLK